MRPHVGTGLTSIDPFASVQDNREAGVGTNMASDEVTDEIASIQMHRQEIERESGVAAARDFALPRLREMLRLEQEALQLHGPGEHRLANIEALSAAIRRVSAAAGMASQRPAQDGTRSGRGREGRRGGQPHAQKSRGRGPMGRKPGR